MPSLNTVQSKRGKERREGGGVSMHQSKLALILRWEEMKACIYVYQAQGWPNQTANCKTRQIFRTILWSICSSACFPAVCLI